MLTDAQRKALTGDCGAAGRRSGGISRRTAGTMDLPLSSGQEQLWFLDRFAPGPRDLQHPVRGAVARASRRGGVGAAPWTGWWRGTRHCGPGSYPVRTALPIRWWTSRPKPELQVTRLDPETALTELVAEEAARPFVLAEGPLFRVRLVRLT